MLANLSFEESSTRTSTWAVLMMERAGMNTATCDAMAPVRRYQDLFAWQLAEEFHRCVVKLVKNSPAGSRDFRFRDQLLNAASDVSKDICEGFLRCSPRVFASFLDYALGSLGEAECRLSDGIGRGYFPPAECAEAFVLARRCFTATIRLKQSQIRHAGQNPSRRRRPGGS